MFIKALRKGYDSGIFEVCRGARYEIMDDVPKRSSYCNLNNFGKSKALNSSADMHDSLSSVNKILKDYLCIWAKSADF